MACIVWFARNDSSSQSARTVIRGAFLALTLGFATATQAINVVEYTLVAQSSSGSTAVSNVFGSGTGAPQTVGSNFAFTATNGSTDVSVSYLPGQVGLQAFTAWPAPGSNSHEGWALVGIYDTLVMNRPAGNTDFGATLTVDILMTGALSTAGGMARWFTEAELRTGFYRGPNFALIQSIIRIDDFTNFGRVDATFGTSGLSLPVTVSSQALGFSNTTDVFPFDAPMDLDWRLYVTASGLGSNSAGSATANLGNTALWLGITARDSQGQIIQGLQFTSESGHNWATAVPLPPTLWMLLTAIGAAVGWRARRPFRG